MMNIMSTAEMIHQQSHIMAFFAVNLMPRRPSTEAICGNSFGSVHRQLIATTLILDVLANNCAGGIEVSRIMPPSQVLIHPGLRLELFLILPSRF
jgi:hypothetical protein